MKHLSIQGRVQGVGYRAFVEREALQRGVEGWVRNRRDGSVEALLIGPKDRVESMVDACREGPPAARVDSVQRFGAREDGEVGFTQLPTG